MFRILLATDGSTGSLKAARFAAHLASEMRECQITMLFVKEVAIPTMGVSDMAGIAMVPDFPVIQEHFEAAAAVALGDTGRLMDNVNVPYTTRSEMGRPAEVICELAKKEGYDLVVMGSRGRGEFAGLIMGSVSDRVMHRSQVPVTIVH